MAKAEGWWQKKGSKWPTLTETMLGNRAITFFARRYAGSILLGMSSTEELEDIKDINPVPEKPSKSAMEEALTGEIVKDVERETSNKKAEEKPVTTEKAKDPKKSEADKKAEEKKQNDAPVETDAGKSEGNPEQEDNASGNPWTAAGLVKNIEGATEISMVNDALSSTDGFSQKDRKLVMQAATKKNKELAAANKD